MLRRPAKSLFHDFSEGANQTSLAASLNTEMQSLGATQDWKQETLTRKDCKTRHWREKPKYSERNKCQLPHFATQRPPLHVS